MAVAEKIFPFPGLPFTFLMCLLCVAIWRAVQVAAGDLEPHGPSFSIGLFDPLYAHPYVDWGSEKTMGSGALLASAVKNIVMAPLTLAKSAKRVYGGKSLLLYLVPSVLLFALAVLFLALEASFGGSWAIGVFFYLGVWSSSSV